MLELTEKRLVSLLWMLKNKAKKWSIFELRKGAAAISGKDDAVYSKSYRIPTMNISLTYGPTFTFIKELEDNQYVSKDPKTSEYGVSKATDLVRLIALQRPVAGQKQIQYYLPAGFGKKLALMRDSKLPYAFTVFAGSELYHSYVKTDQVHAYIKEGDEKKWEKYLLSKNCLKAQKNQANIFLIPTKQQIFFTKPRKIKGFSMPPTPVLLSDLFSFGGLAEEQANFLLEEWLNDRL